MDTVSKLVNLISELREIAEDVDGFFTIDVNKYSEMEVHVNFPNVFFELFKDFDVINRKDGKYPYKVVVDVEGVKFYAVLDEKGYNKYIKKTA